MALAAACGSSLEHHHLSLQNASGRLIASNSAGNHLYHDQYSVDMLDPTEMLAGEEAQEARCTSTTNSFILASW
jgi:hypothetical protein